MKKRQACWLSAGDGGGCAPLGLRVKIIATTINGESAPPWPMSPKSDDERY